MKSIIRRMAAVVLLPLLFFSHSAWAENNSNLIFNATTTNFGALIIGNSGTNNSLQIYNAGAVTNTTATVGSGAGASNNYVIVSDLGSIWDSTGQFILGGGAGGNSLTITNGGKVYALSGTGTSVGNTAASANNTILVAGNGSLWTNVAALTLGTAGGGNQMTIANSGRVDALHAFIGGGDNNTVLVTDPGSLFSLSASGSFEVGFGGKNNTLTIANGGLVVDSGGYIGVGGSNNSAVVNGGVWSNTSTMNLGYTSGYNQLTVTNGGKVYSAGGGNVGGALSTSINAGNCSVLVSGVNSLWSGGPLLIGDYAGQSSLTVSNNALVSSTTASVGKVGSPGTELEFAL